MVTGCVIVETLGRSPSAVVRLHIVGIFAILTHFDSLSVNQGPRDTCKNGEQASMSAATATIVMWLHGHAITTIQLTNLQWLVEHASSVVDVGGDFGRGRAQSHQQLPILFAV